MHLFFIIFVFVVIVIVVSIFSIFTVVISIGELSGDKRERVSQIDPCLCVDFGLFFLFVIAVVIVLLVFAVFIVVILLVCSTLMPVVGHVLVGRFNRVRIATVVVLVV